MLLLALAVLAPTVCLLWFMNIALRNESLAVRQKLTEAYRSQLSALPARLEVFWQKTAEEMERHGKEVSASGWFALVVQAAKADAFVVLDSQGHPVYPDSPSASGSDRAEPDPQWVEANRLEWLDRDWLEAARRYEAIANQSSNTSFAAQALQAQARCLVQAGKKKDAVNLITQRLEQERYREAADAQGRVIVANDELMVLELLKDPASSLFQITVEKLRQRLGDYQHSVMASPQRRFLMKELQRYSSTNLSFPTLAGEELAAGFLDTHPSLPDKSNLCPTPLTGLWQLRTPNGRGLALFRTETVLRRLRYLLENNAEMGADVSLSISPPGAPSETPFVSLAAGQAMPGWQLAVSLKGPNPFEAATKQRLAAYLWACVLIVLAVYILAVLAARSLQRQVALSRLKNDLVATVSHELKTPLASIRVLVDTLLAADQFDRQTTREYLQLIAKENDRLGRVVENFLTFSRMERNKYAFRFSRMPASQIVESVVQSVRPRFDVPGCDFQVQMPQRLPEIEADPDTLTTALLNLLDNAFKYTELRKLIVLRATAANGRVAFEVEDNGIGIAPRETARIFQDFYQVDQQLSRKGGGCGLGLSIVNLIVKAHHGSVLVRSQLGQGSKFTLVIPALSDAGAPGKPATA